LGKIKRIVDEKRGVIDDVKDRRKGGSLGETATELKWGRKVIFHFEGS
jgi:hypothetical protein